MIRNYIALFAALFSVAAGAAEEPFGVTADSTFSEGGNTQLQVKFRIQEGHYLYADRIKVEPKGGLLLTLTGKPEPVKKYDEFSQADENIYERDTVYSYAVERGTNLSGEIQVSYQGCSKTMCFMPATKILGLDFAAAGTGERKQAVAGKETQNEWHNLKTRYRVAASGSGYMPAKDFIRFLDSRDSGNAPMDNEEARRKFENTSPWISILLIMLGGLALNLTPCVLPMIPVSIAIIGGGMGAGSKMRGLALGGMYGLGMAASYGLLGLFVILTGSRFGMLNSSPWFNIAVAGIFLLLSLAMFDLFSIDFSRFQKTAPQEGERRGGYLPAMVMGGVAALLAGACVAPVVVFVLLVSTDLYASGKITGLFLPFLLGVGMALPWPFAGAGLSFLPKPGKWMVRIKQVFGLVIIAAAAWYGFMGVKLLRERSPRAMAEVAASQEKGIADRGCMVKLESALQRAESENKPIFLDFWASWCKSCLEMERTTFIDPEVEKKLQGFISVKCRAEDPSDPATRQMLDHFMIVGLPTYLILEPLDRPEGLK